MWFESLCKAPRWDPALGLDPKTVERVERASLQRPAPLLKQCSAERQATAKLIRLSQSLGPGIPLQVG